MLRPLGVALLPFLLLACSTTSLQQQFRNLDHESKDLFMAYYPELTPDQRRTALDSDYPLQEMFKAWKIKETPGYRPEIGSLEIEALAPDPIVSGDSVELKATLKYRDGRTADATRDVVWSAEPDLARMDENHLRFDCAASDVTVTAIFVGERSGTKTIRLRKPVQSLEISLEGASQNSDQGEFFHVQALARCQDGTSADVSCQADWSLIDSPGQIEACGRYRLGERSVEGNRFTVRADYGNQTLTRKLGAPGRRPAGGHELMFRY